MRTLGMHECRVQILAWIYGGRVCSFTATAVTTSLLACIPGALIYAKRSTGQENTRRKFVGRSSDIDNLGKF